jgi:hypothetical protein
VGSGSMFGRKYGRLVHERFRFLTLLYVRSKRKHGAGN